MKIPGRTQIGIFCQSESVWYVVAGHFLIGMRRTRREARGLARSLRRAAWDNGYLNARRGRIKFFCDRCAGAGAQAMYKTEAEYKSHACANPAKAFPGFKRILAATLEVSS